MSQRRGPLGVSLSHLSVSTFPSYFEEVIFPSSSSTPVGSAMPLSVPGRVLECLEYLCSPTPRCRPHLCTGAVAPATGVQRLLGPLPRACSFSFNTAPTATCKVANRSFCFLPRRPQQKVHVSKAGRGRLENQNRAQRCRSSRFS